MNPAAPSRLSEIATAWELVRRAHDGTPSEALAAQEELLARYRRAVFGYLCACTRDPASAEELFQAFWCGFVEGRFRGADPGKGRFRQYVKTALAHLVADHRRREGRSPGDLPTEVPGHAAATPIEEDVASFNDHWRQELLARAWESLERNDTEAGYYPALRLRAAHPDAAMSELAAMLAAELGREVKPDATRQLIRRAREQFAEYLYLAAAESLREPTPESVAEELAEVGLLDYCRRAVVRRTQG